MCSCVYCVVGQEKSLKERKLTDPYRSFRCFLKRFITVIVHSVTGFWAPENYEQRGEGVVHETSFCRSEPFVLLVILWLFCQFSFFQNFADEELPDRRQRIRRGSPGWISPGIRVRNQPVEKHSPGGRVAQNHGKCPAHLQLHSLLTMLLLPFRFSEKPFSSKIWVIFWL